MGEIKHNFEGIAKFNATMIFMALAASPLSFLTNGVVGKITFFFLKSFSNWLANQGLALANIGFDAIVIAEEKGNYNEVFDEALREVLRNKNKLTDEQRREIDDKVKAAFRDFATFT